LFQSPLSRSARERYGRPVSDLRINSKFSEYARIGIDPETWPLRHGDATALWIDRIAERGRIEIAIKTLDPYFV
jgi:hypothetical protein